jgi:hypothetical protein
MLDEGYYSFVKLTDAQRAAYEAAYQSALKISRRHAQAQFAAERAVFAQARRDRHQQQDEAARRMQMS